MKFLKEAHNANKLEERKEKKKKKKIQVAHKGPPSGNEFNKSYYALLNISTCLNFLVISQCPNDFIYHALTH